MSKSPKVFVKGQRVGTFDPDLERLTPVFATYHGFDDKTGDHLVVLDHEPDAVRRIKADNVAGCTTALKLQKPF